MYIRCLYYHHYHHDYYYLLQFNTQVKIHKATCNMKLIFAIKSRALYLIHHHYLMVEKKNFYQRFFFLSFTFLLYCNYIGILLLLLKQTVLLLYRYIRYYIFIELIIWCKGGAADIWYGDSGFNRNGINAMLLMFIPNKNLQTGYDCTKQIVKKGFYIRVYIGYFPAEAEEIICAKWLR